MKVSYFRLSALLICALAGCSSANTAAPRANHATAAESSVSAAITITDFAGRTIHFEQIPQRIAALSNGEVDIISALGGTLVGRPASNSPLPTSEMENIPTIGSTHEIDLEKAAFAQPEVVLGNDPMNAKDIPSVEGIGAKMILTSANSVDDIQKQITLLGQLIGKEDKAKQLNQELTQQLATLQQQQTEQKPKVLLVYGAPGTYMAALPNSLSGNILERAGGTNIAADLPGLQNYPQYAQLNTERIIEADPDYVFIMTHGSSDEVKAGFLKEMQDNQAWSSVRAVQNNQVEVLPSDLFGTNPGTRVTEALDLLHGLIYPDLSDSNE